jgi:predicted ATP-grasp superfamily ATP-dependent carboligase
MKRERIVLLDGGTTQALACARSLGRAGAGILVASRRRRPMAAWSRFCEARYRLVDESVDAFAGLRDWARRRGATRILPLTERSHFLLNAERAQWLRAGIAPACADDDQLMRAFDKARTVRLAEQSGAAVPTTRIPESVHECRDIAAAVGLPCIVKSRFSAGWDGTRLLGNLGTSYVRTLGELEAAVLRHRQGEHWPLVQRFVQGQGKGIFTVCDGGRAITWFSHERLRDVRPTGSGSSLRRAAAVEPRLREPAERLLAAMEWHGPAMVEFRDDGTNSPWVMEVNGRFWGSLQLAVAAGVDFPRMWIAVLRGEPVETPPSFREDVTLRWVWGDVKRLLNVLAGPPAGFPDRYPTRWEGMREVLGPQPPGTRSETWDAGDPWPAVGEWVQGIGELVGYGLRAGGLERFRRSRSSPPARGAAGEGAPVSSFRIVARTTPR